MADFQEAFRFTMGHEDPHLRGVIVDEPGGGRARFGVNSIAHPEAISAGFYDMPVDQALDYAEDLFKYCYWGKVNGYHIDSQRLANQIADLAYNEGTKTAIRLLQDSVNAIFPTRIEEDGVFGIATLAAVNALDETELLTVLKQHALAHYEAIYHAHPDKYSEADFISWKRRLNA